MEFILFVGSNNTLASSEVETQIKKATEISPNIFSFQNESEKEAVGIASSLGSSLKLAIRLSGVTGDADSISSQIVSKNFSISVIQDSQLGEKMARDTKNLIQKGRFVASSEYFGLSPIQNTKHKIDEFFIDQDNAKVYKTIWVHNFRHWIEKDRHMPYFDARAGMLPPKIARSMVNLVPGNPNEMLLVDPFCGSGRILIEARERGFHIKGIDIIEKQVNQSRQNLNYLKLEGEVFLGDSTHLSDIIADKVDAIVTEPFLGKPNPRPDRIKFIVPGLKKLYLGCLKDWHKRLKEGGIVVMVFPVFFDGKNTFKTSDVIDSKQSIGYNHLKRDLLYSRPGADIKREIVILQKIEI